jgi:hypothetical protein
MTTQPPRPGDTLRSFDRGQQQRQQQDQQRRREQERQQREREAMTTPRQDVPRPGETLGIERRGPQRPTPERRDPRQQVEEARRIAAQERFTQAQEALGNRSIIEYVAQGGDLERLTDLGIDAETVATLRAIQPHLNGDGRTVDVPGALQAGVTPDVLGRVVDRRAVQQVQEALAAPTPTVEAPATPEAQDIPTDRPLPQQELSELPIGAALMQEAAQQPLTMPTPRPTGPVMPTAGQNLSQLSPDHINSLNRQAGLVQSIVIGGAAPGQDLNNAMRLAQQRANLAWSEFNENVSGLRSAYTVTIPQIQRQIGATQNRLNILNNIIRQGGGYGWGTSGWVTPENARSELSNYQAQLERQQADLQRWQAAQSEFDRYVQQLRPVLQETIRDSIEAVRRTVTAETLPAGVVRADPTRSTDEIQAVLQDVRTYEDLGRALEEGRVTQAELTSMGFSTEDVQQAQQVAQQASILARTGTTGEVAIQAFREGRATEADLAMAFSPSDAAQIVQIAAERRTTALELGLPEGASLEEINAEIRRRNAALEFRARVEAAEVTTPPEEELAVAPGRQESVISAVQELGPHAAVQQGRATAAEVTEVFGPDVFRATPVEDLAIDPGRTIPIRQDEAITELGRMGFTDQQGGVFVADAAMSGQDALLLQAGFTQGQIDQAVSQRITPTAEPMRRPAPGETLPVPAELQAQRDAARREIGTGILAMVGDRDVPAVARTVDEIAREELQGRRFQLMDNAIQDVQTGDLTPEQAREIFNALPEQPTEADIARANEIYTMHLRLASPAPIAGPFLGAIATARAWPEATPRQRTIDVALDTLGFVSLGLPAFTSARSVGAAAMPARLGFAAREVLAGEVVGAAPLILQPDRTVRAMGRTVWSPVEVVLTRGRRVPSAVEQIRHTPRILADPAEAARMPTDPSLIAPTPGGTLREMEAGIISPPDMKLAVNEAALNVMQRGRSDPVRAAEGSETLVHIRPSLIQDTLGHGATHASPDIRNILAGPVRVEGAEGGMFFSVAPHTRFADATSRGAAAPDLNAVTRLQDRAAQLERSNPGSPEAIRARREANEALQAWQEFDQNITPAAREMIERLELPNEPLPGMVLLNDPHLLSLLRGSEMLPDGSRTTGLVLGSPGNVPKIYRGLAEVEAVLPRGTVIPQASQRLDFIGPDGTRYAIAVIGDPLTAAQRARMGLRGPQAAMQNLVLPPVRLTFEGEDAVQALAMRADALRRAGQADEAARLQRQADLIAADAMEAGNALRVDNAAEAMRRADGLADMAGEARAAGNTRLASDFTAQANDARALGRQLTREVSSTRATVASLRAGQTAIAINERGELHARPGDATALDRVGRRGVDSLVPAEPDTPPDVGRLEEAPRLTPRQAGQRIGSLARLAEIAEDEPLTRAEQQRAAQLITDLGRADISGMPDRDIVEPRVVGDDVVRVGRAALAPDAPLQRDARGRFVRREPVVTPELTPARTSTPTAPPRTPDAPRTPDRPRVPTTPEMPRVPEVPRIPTPERPRIPGPTPTPVPGTTPRTTPGDLPDPDTFERDGDGRLNLRVIGFNRGFLDTKVDLVTGEARSVRDIPEVPQTELRRSIREMERSPDIPQTTRVRMGFHDAIFDRRGELVGWVDAKEPIPDELIERARRNNQGLRDRSLQSRPRTRNNNPFRSRGMGRRRF